MFNNMREAWIHDANLLLAAPSTLSRSGVTREIVGHTYSLADPRSCWAGGGRKGSQSLGYGFAELLWYLSGSDTMEMLGAYAPSYSKYCNDGRAMGAYGFRWRSNPGIAGKSVRGALVEVIELLKKNPDDRRAVLAMWDSGDVVEAALGVWNDIPCTLSIQYLIRNNQLHSVVTMRSNDLWLGGVYDPFTFCQLQCLVAAAIGCDVGHYHHRVGSFHMYEKNAEAIAAVLLDESSNGHMEWRAPEIDKGEAINLIYSNASSPLMDAEFVMRSSGNDILRAINILPDSHRWSATALKSLHYHLTKRSKP
jgi:thymidylate synthase